MQQQKETNNKIDFIAWFSELNKNSGKIAGGKGANLAEIYNLKIPVPPGFVVTAQAYDYFLTESKLNDKINELLDKIDYEDTAQLNEVTKQIRTLILDSKFPKEMEKDILDAYEDLDTDEFDFAKGSALDILNKTSEPIFVAVRSSATAEDLPGASFAGQQDSFVNIKGKAELLKHIKKCFASLYTSRATYYRNKKGFKHAETSLAVVVQKMVDSDKSGVIFSKDPTYKNENTIIEAVWGLGEGIVSGKITPDKYVTNKELEILDKKIADKKIAITRDSGGNKVIAKLREEKSKHQVISDYEIRKLTEFATQLEEHYNKPQDIEFAIEGEEIYIVQTRPITTIEKRISETGQKEIQGEVILTGIPASPGIASGKIRIIEDLADLSKIKTGDILVTKMTNPDMVVTMQKSAAIVTDDGGMTAHAAIVSREMGIPAIVGTQEATTKLKEGEIITVDGFTGKIYKGKTSETITKEVLPVTAETKTKIKVIVDLPTFAKRAAQSEIKSVGLTRIEGIIAESGKHPEYFKKQNKISEYEEVIFNGVEGIAKHFEELWVRTSDIRSDEFGNLEGAPKEKEANPMLGMHGIRYSLENPEIFKAELNALKRISEKGKTIGLLFPQIISIDEIQKAKKIISEINFTQAKIGVMVETPAAVQLIREICAEGIDFISFGTNDLTQYILAVDRGNEKVQHLFDEMNPAILNQLEYVIRVCKRKNVETSICGQSGSRKEMVKFLVGKGIDSISVNADMAKEISDYIAELEKEKGEEPRQYQPEKDVQEPSSKTPIKYVQEEENEADASDNEVVNNEKPINNVANEQPSLDNNPPNESPSDSEEEIPPQTPEKIQEDIQAIEQEKKQYLDEHPEEIRKEKNLEEVKEENFSNNQPSTDNINDEVYNQNIPLDNKSPEEPEFQNEEEIQKHENDFEEENIEPQIEEKYIEPSQDNNSSPNQSHEPTASEQSEKNPDDEYLDIF